MSLKKNLSIIKILDTTLIGQKLFNITRYPKSYVRGDLLQNQNLKLLDQYITSTVLESTIVKNHLNNALINCTGVSINSQRFNFKHVIIDSLQFQKSSHVFAGSSVMCLQSFIRSLEHLQQQKNKFSELLLLNPIKGGFCCYFSGLYGFLPKSHARLVFKRLARKFKNFTQNLTSLSKIQLFSQKIYFQKCFLFRFPLKGGTFSIRQVSQRSKFVSKKKHSTDVDNQFNGSLRIVLLVHNDQKIKKN